ncbi:MAG: GAK system CofD-like protein [Proteobacteria bacterium]|nr:GAK system CofD-like protein [Pseudomonadota bacterium]
MAIKLKIAKTMTLPDGLRLARYARAPELGPKILFFSGGSALNPVSRFLTRFTHNTIHLVTPFDSGGSSAKLRQSFNMPAVGDLRNRLMALADQSVIGNPEVIRLFSYRLPAGLENRDLVAILGRMIDGVDDMVAEIPDPLRKIIRTHLKFFHDRMPPDFDLKGASIGNLVLTGGYLNNGRQLDPVAYIFAKLAEVRGTVRTILNKDLHLAAELADGRVIVGQHRITGREVPPLATPIRHVYLTDRVDRPVPVRPVIREKTIDLIAQAELICFPMGSFFSSLIANLLPKGVSRAVMDNDCPKIFIPNTGLDKELFGHDLASQVELLGFYLKQDIGEQAPLKGLLDFVLLDSRHGDYPGLNYLPGRLNGGAKIVDAELITPRSHPYLDPEKVSEILLSFV